MEGCGLDGLRRLQERTRGAVGNDDVTLSGAIDTRAAAPPAIDLGLCDRLRKRFGLGDDPKRRLVLYRRLETLFLQHGQLVWTLCSEAAAQAVGTTNPGRYFSKAIVGKLRDHGLVPKLEGGEL